MAIPKREDGKVYHWKHGWIPADTYAQMIPESRKAAKPTIARLPKASSAPSTLPTGRSAAGFPAPPRGTAWAHTRVLPSTGLGSGVVSDKSRRATPALMDSLRANGGFTFNPKTGKVLEVGKAKGFAVAVPGTETPIGSREVTREAFAKALAAVIMKHSAKFAKGGMLGGWYSPERNQFMVEVTEIHADKGKAILLGKARNQEAIFDLATGDTIGTGGTGDARAS